VHEQKGETGQHFRKAALQTANCEMLAYGREQYIGKVADNGEQWDMGQMMGSSGILGR
jgi:hypothetical protein